MPWTPGSPPPSGGTPSGGFPSGGTLSGSSDPTPGPWGSPPGGNGGRPPSGPRPPPRGPGGPRGPFGGGFGGGKPPDLDAIIARILAWLRNLLPGRGGAGRGAVLLAIAVVGIWLASGFYRVEPDQQGVVLRFGAYDRTTLPGLNYHFPWPIETVETPAVTRINRIEIGFRSAPGGGGVIQSGPDSQGRDVLAESLMLTGDENIVDIDFVVLWRIRNPVDYLFNTRDPARTVKAVAESAMREVIGRTPIQAALTQDRAQIEQSVLDETQTILSSLKAGVEITQVQLQKSDPPEAVIESFNDVQRANTDADRMRNEADSYRNDIVPRARGDAAKILADADAQRQASVALATGQTKQFLSVLAAYQQAREVTLKRMYIETMQDVLSHAPAVIVDPNLRGLVPFLPLDHLPKPPPAPTPPPSPAPDTSGSTPQ